MRHTTCMNTYSVTDLSMMSVCYHECLQMLMCIKSLTSIVQTLLYRLKNCMQAGDIQQWQVSYPSRDTQIFQKSYSHLKILGARRITSSMFHTVDPQILGAMAQKLVVHVTWHLGFEHPCVHKLMGRPH